MLRMIQNNLTSAAEKPLAEKQAIFVGMDQLMFTHIQRHILIEKLPQYSKDLYHNFINFI